MSAPAELVPFDRVEAIVAQRDALVEKYETAHRLLEGFVDTMESADRDMDRMWDGEVSSEFRPHLSTQRFRYNHDTELRKVRDKVGGFREYVDRAVWTYVVDRTRIGRLMDARAREEFRESIEGDDVPVVDAASIRATLESLVESSGDIWRRGIANVFSSLDRRFRSHDGFKLGSRVVLSGAFDSWGSWNTYRDHRETIRDIERVLVILDGGDWDEHRSIVADVDQDRTGWGPKQSVTENGYLRIRAFKNGNAHLWFLRDDLVRKVNLELHAYYGAGLGWGSGGYDDGDPSAEFRDGAIGRPVEEAYYPTPLAVVERMVELAKLRGAAYRGDVLDVLEPSAGEGAIAGVVAEMGHRVTCVEVDERRRESLCRHSAESVAGRPMEIHRADFTTWIPGRRFDAVLMNPPFNGGRDVDHVWLALDLLRPGGVLVSVMSAGAEFSSRRRAVLLRERLESMGAQWQDLPQGTFKASGTNVNTRLVTVRTPADEPEKGRMT